MWIDWEHLGFHGTSKGAGDDVEPLLLFVAASAVTFAAALAFAATSTTSTAAAAFASAAVRFVGIQEYNLT